MLHTLYSGAFPWVFLGYAPLLGEIFQLQPKACYANDHKPSCNTQLLKDPLLWRVSLTEDSSCDFLCLWDSGSGPPRCGEVAFEIGDTLGVMHLASGFHHIRIRYPVLGDI